jgi:hypothetical protein
MTPDRPVDWDGIASRLQHHMNQMVHVEGWSGPDFYAEALRRAFGYQQRDPYDYVQQGSGLTTQQYADYVREGHTIVDRTNLQTAERQIRELRGEVTRVYRDAGADIAQMLRDRCNERTVPSRYRREGVLWAADMIDPAVPKDRYGNVIAPPADPPPSARDRQPAPPPAQSARPAEGMPR